MSDQVNRQGLDNYAQVLAEKTLTTFFNQNEAIGGKEIMTFTPVEQINVFILQKLFAKWKEEENNIKSPYFDYSHEQVKEVMQQLMEMLSHHIRVKRDDFFPLLKSAIEDMFELILEPVNFIKYKYLNYEEIKIEFDRIITDTKYIKLNRFLIDDTIESFNAIISNEVNVEDFNDKLVQVYQNNKDQLTDIADILDQLHGVCPVNKDQIFAAKEELTLPVFETETAKVEEVIDEEQTTVEVQEEEDLSADQSEENKLKDLSIENDADVEEPLSEVIEEEKEALDEILEEKEAIGEDELSGLDEEADVPNVVEGVQESEQSKKTLNDVFSAEKKTLNDLHSNKNKESLSLGFAGKKVTTLESAMSINQKYLFINQLFEGSKSEFEEAVSEVNKLSDYESASNYLIDNFAKKYNWDKKEAEVEGLFQLLTKRF